MLQCVKSCLLCAYIKRREVENGTRKIRSKKLREHQYREVYGRCLESEREDNGMNKINVEEMWGQVKKAMVESKVEIRGSVRRKDVGGGGGSTRGVCGGMMW